MIRYLKEDQNYNNKVYFIKHHTGLLLRDKFDIWTMYQRRIIPSRCIWTIVVERNFKLLLKIASRQDMI